MAMQGGAGDDPDRGRRIGKYEILTRLSMGGMAELFLAFTSGPGGFRKFVAVKQILPDIKKDDQFVKMFLDEARITAAFSHANIGQVFDLGEDGGELYLAMEFLPGQNLEQVVKAASRLGFPLPLGFVGRIIRDACLGLHYAHHFTDPSGRPSVVVHRDVSPKNVMITYDGVVKVIDFGIAKARGRLGRTQVGMVKGTSGYMSPEQVRGNTTLDGRSDLFSVGVMLHELLSGQRLFHGPHEAAVMLQIVEGEIPSPRSVNPAIPEALEAVVMRALSREVFQRFTSGREMARAIEAALGQELFDEDGISEVMGQLFEEKRQKTRTLLELASRAEDARVSEAADALQQEEAEASAPTAQVQAPRSRLTPAGATDGSLPTRAGTPPRPAPPRRNTAEATATRVNPPSSVPQRRPTEQGSRTPRPPAEPAQASRTPRPRPASRAEPATPDVTQPLEEQTELSTQRFRARPQRPARDEARTSVRPARPGPASRSDTPQDDLPAVRPPSRWKGRLALLALVAGLGWLSTLPAVRAQFVPAYESARAWVKAELDPQPAADPATSAPWPPAPKAGPPPGFPGTAAAQAPAAGTRDTPSEEPAQAEEAEAPTEQAPPSKKAPGVRTASATAPGRKGKDGAAATQAPAPKQETSAAGTARPGRTQGEDPAAAPEAQDPGALAEVVDTSTPRGAAKAGLGWLTLSTVPPAAVFDGANQLGTTPMRKVLLPVGVHRLRVEDPTDAVPASRLLSAPIRPGEVTQITIRLADLPLYKE